jgi:hypothetical protein
MLARTQRLCRVLDLRRACVAGVLLLALSGCVTTRPGSPAPPASIDSLWRDYERAVEDAKFPRPARVSRELVPLVTWFDGLVWDEARQKLLMVTWTKAAWFTPGEMKLVKPTWLTAAPFLQRFCQASGLQGRALDLRLQQRLGLPPNGAYDAFAEVWIDPADLFRPCPDPEIGDRECQVNLTTGTGDRNAACPWSTTQQVSGKFVKVSSDHLNWMCSKWSESYPPGKPRDSYPWTALGYTYDWSSSSPNHVGDSEFVAPQGTAVVVRRVAPTGQYCAPASRRESRP